ncbi:hypothetical protein GCM10019059_02760 [Camelimonas fluminis]|nr:hypothetical protein GCM10019059_02760 [Camelimonas fluminis]
MLLAGAAGFTKFTRDDRGQISAASVRLVVHARLAFATLAHGPWAKVIPARIQAEACLKRRPGSIIDLANGRGPRSAVVLSTAEAARARGQASGPGSAGAWLAEDGGAKSGQGAAQAFVFNAGG